MATSGRVILHLDLDCFYCQVEQKRLQIPREVPAAVQQWDGLIAINYAARALGISRHMRVQEAMRKCPELQCIHVQTLGGENGQEGSAGPVNAGSVHPNDRSLQKACLERYRRASAEIIAVIRTMLPQVKIEKASIDEVYIDVTNIVETELAERDDGAVSEHARSDAFAWGSIVEGGPLDTESEYDRRLSVGAATACRVRGAVRDKLDFTCSVGIAQNKLLAKVGSARNKPNQQTIVTARGIHGLMKGLPLKKLRNFGGKLGAELQALGATTAGEVACMPLKQLQEHFGDKAQWILNCVRGLQDEPVQVRELSKSMLAAKSFEATSDVAALGRWLGILADELAERMVTDMQLHQRFPRLLVLSYRPKDQAAGRSRSIAMPKAPAPGPTAAMLKEAAVSVLAKCPDALPCCNLGLTATEFQDTPGDEQGCITRFFQPRAQDEKAAAPSGQGAKPSGNSSSSSSIPKRPPQPKRVDSMFRDAVKKGTAHMSPAESLEQNQEKRAAGGESPAAEEDIKAGDPQPGSEKARPESSIPNGGSASAANAAEACEPQHRKAAEESPPGATENEAGGSRDLPDVADDPEGELGGVDLEEQRRIMRDIRVRNIMSRGHGNNSTKRLNKSKAAPPKQPRLTDMAAWKHK